MLGLGESREEVLSTLDDLRAAGVDVVNIGQYLQPTRNNIPVQRYWSPQEFAGLKEAAMEMGFLYCESGPLVRSSYHAGEQYMGVREHLRKIRAARGTIRAHDRRLPPRGTRRPATPSRPARRARSPRPACARSLRRFIRAAFLP